MKIWAGPSIDVRQEIAELRRKTRGGRSRLGEILVSADCAWQAVAMWSLAWGFQAVRIPTQVSAAAAARFFSTSSPALLIGWSMTA